MEPAIHAAARDARAVLLANHGPVVSGRTLTDAVYAAEELEEAAKLFLLLRGRVAAAADAAAGGRSAGAFRLNPAAGHCNIPARSMESRQARPEHGAEHGP